MQGYNGGPWTGLSGITSSAAAVANNAAIGVAPGGTVFDGQTVTSSDVLVKYTYYGDANLDGQVNSIDYTMIDNSVNQDINTGWQNGDFNYDNNINGDDYTLIDNAFNTQNLPAAPQSAKAQSLLAPSSLAPAVRQIAVNSFWSQTPIAPSIIGQPNDDKNVATLLTPGINPLVSPAAKHEMIYAKCCVLQPPPPAMLILSSFPRHDSENLLAL